MTTEIPILFSTDMVKANAQGLKTMTRRVIDPQPDRDGLWNDDAHPRSIESTLHGWNGTVDETGESRGFKCRYGKPGDILWVRESFVQWVMNRNHPSKQKNGYYYKADFADDTEQKFKPSIHMPKDAARQWLSVESVRVERVHDISDDDILKEGIRIPVNKESGGVLFKLGEYNSALSFLPNGCLAKGAEPLTQHQLLFAHWAELWCRINGRESWDANPWVWVVEYKVLSLGGRPVVAKKEVAYAD